MLDDVRVTEDFLGRRIIYDGRSGEFHARVVVSEELLEDARFSIEGFVREQLVREIDEISGKYDADRAYATAVAEERRRLRLEGGAVS